VRNLQQPSINSVDICLYSWKFDGCFGFELLLLALIAHLGEHELEGVDQLYVAEHVFLIHQLDELLQDFVLLLFLG
jgi:hypothetical protein